jgi:hypothetical protein
MKNDRPAVAQPPQIDVANFGSEATARRHGQRFVRRFHLQIAHI